VDGAENDVESARCVNHFAVKYLAEACKKYNIPFIHISTDYIFDGEKVTGYNEEDVPNPKNIYGLTKLEGEDALKNTWEKHIILRVSWVFSEFGKNFVKTIARVSETKDCLSVVCDQFGAPTAAKSIAEVIIQLCKKLHAENNMEKYWGVYHFSDFPVTNWQQFAKHVVRLKHPNKNIEIVAIESKDYPTAAQRPKYSILNTQKIENTFNINQKFWMNEVDRVIKTI
jgi:dTDP-4-dehydrorhamnose reductase